MLEIPLSPCYTFRDTAGNCIAIYENLRPEVMRQFNGRMDKEWVIEIRQVEEIYEVFR